MKLRVFILPFLIGLSFQEKLMLSKCENLDHSECNTQGLDDSQIDFDSISSIYNTKGTCVYEIVQKYLFKW